MQRCIVVGVDGSNGSERAVRWCADHADGFADEVVVVHAIETPVYEGYAGLGAAMYPIVLSEDERKELHDVVARDWCKPLADAGVAHRVLLVDGAPSVVLKQVADEVDAQLVVTGRRGHGGFAELLLGSTSHQLSHHLGRPLVIVP